MNIGNVFHLLTIVSSFLVGIVVYILNQNIVGAMIFWVFCGMGGVGIGLFASQQKQGGTKDV